MSTLRAHIAVLRDLASHDPTTTMVQLATIGALEETVEEVDRLAEAVDRLERERPPPPDDHLGTI